MSKYIFVTGGVVSGLGKGITAASIGLILKSSGLSVDAVKFDPYLNVDPGTMSPYEHGEVYVLKDGSETDLDLGHYERFLNVNLTGISSVTAGKIYTHILDREREGQFLGKNVQLIPHVTNYIKECFARDSSCDVRIIEIGGSTGDFEGEVFLESFRQFRRENKGQVLHVHLGYVPFLKCSGEYKSKPLQTSIRELLKSGLQPDIVVARYSIENGIDLDQSILDKIALFSNLGNENVIALPDLENIYKVPLYLLSNSNIQNSLQTYLKTELQPVLPDFFKKIQNPLKFKVKIGIVAKYNKLLDSYLSIIEALKIAGVELNSEVEIIVLDAEALEKKDPEVWDNLKNVQGIIVPGGFGNRGMEGKILAAQYARENQIPYLGICLGLQMAIVEFARNICGVPAYSSEMFSSRDEMLNKEIVIDLMPDQLNIYKKGGTMRLGDYDCWIEPDTLASRLFTDWGSTTQDHKIKITERHRHRLEVQSKYISTFEEKGMVISGKHWYLDKNQDQKFLVELVELEKTVHPYFISTQSHPEFLGRPNKPHPLFKGLLEAALSGFSQ